MVADVDREEFHMVLLERGVVAAGGEKLDGELPGCEVVDGNGEELQGHAANTW